MWNVVAEWLNYNEDGWITYFNITVKNGSVPFHKNAVITHYFVRILLVATHFCLLARIEVRHFLWHSIIIPIATFAINIGIQNIGICSGGLTQIERSSRNSGNQLYLTLTSQVLRSHIKLRTYLIPKTYLISSAISSTLSLCPRSSCSWSHPWYSYVYHSYLNLFRLYNCRHWLSVCTYSNHASKKLNRKS